MAPTVNAPLDFPGRFPSVVGGWIADLRTGQFWASKGWADMIDETPELVGSRIDDWLGRVHKEDRETLKEDLALLSRQLSETLSAQVRLRTAHGHFVWVQVQGKRFGTTIMGCQIDIDPTKEREMRTTKSESRFRTLVEHSPDAIAVHRQGRFIYLNQKMLLMLGRDEGDQLLGRSILSIVHPDDAEILATRAHRLVSDVQYVAPTVEVRLLRNDRSEVAVEMQSLVMEFDDEPAVFDLARDVTERRKMQSRLAHADRMASLGLLAATVAHEINNPLAYINANLESLLCDLPRVFQNLAGGARAGSDSVSVIGDIMERLADAHQGSQRIRSIVSDLRTFTNPGEGTVHAVDLEAVIQAALKLAQPELRHRTQVRLDFGDVGFVRGDEGRLCQVFLNVLVNAGQVMDETNLLANEVYVRTSAQGQQAVVQITDNGVGMESYHLARVFEPFFTTKPPGVGSGLGLSISRHILESFGGEITIDSQLGHGTTVSIRLPRAEADAHVDGAMMQVQEPLTATGTHSAVSEQRLRVLLIDDDTRLRRAFERELSRDFDVVAVGGGQEAIDYLNKFLTQDYSETPLDCILCDLCMPGLSGEDVHHWITEQMPNLLPRLVFFTGGAVTDAARAFVQRVQNTVVQKPIEMETLRRVIRDNAALCGTGVSPDEVFTPQRERRGSARISAATIAGMLVAPQGDARIGIKLVDYSATGVRVTRPKLSPPAGTAFHMVLFRADATDVVEAQVEFVRRVSTPQGDDLCFRLIPADDVSRQTYDGWLKTDMESMPA